jgi:hypothetical protein
MIYVSTKDYEVAHGKQPRGFGQWAFFMEEERDVTKAFFLTGNYGDTVKRAKSYARTMGYRFIRIGS